MTEPVIVRSERRSRVFVDSGLVSWHIYVGELLHAGLRRIVVVSRYFEGFYGFQIIQTPRNTSKTHVLLNIELFCRLWTDYARFHEFTNFYQNHRFRVFLY